MKKRAGHFNRYAKRAALAGAALLSFGAVAGAATPASPPMQPPTIADMLLQQAQQEQQPKIKYAHSQARLDQIEADMAQVPLGRALIDFADKENIRIEMSNAKVMDDNPKDRITIKGLNYSTLIRLNGDIKSDSEVMITLAHEIRHSWHERQLGNDDLALTPRNEWLKRRIQEADCFAFEIHFAYEYEKATGKRLDLGDRNPPAGQSTYAGMLGDYARARADKNKTVGDAYSQLLQKSFSHVHKQGYDKSFTTHLARVWTDVAAKPGLRPSYKARLENPASDADFVAAMRLVATAGLVPGTDPAALAKWIDADFLGFEKTGGKPSKANLKLLDTAELKYREAKQAWQEQNAPKPLVIPPLPPAVAPPPAPAT